MDGFSLLVVLTRSVYKPGWFYFGLEKGNLLIPLAGQFSGLCRVLLRQPLPCGEEILRPEPGRTLSKCIWLQWTLAHLAGGYLNVLRCLQHFSKHT